MPQVRVEPIARVVGMGERMTGMVPPTVWGEGGARGFVFSRSVGVRSDPKNRPSLIEGTFHRLMSLNLLRIEQLAGFSRAISTARKTRTQLRRIRCDRFASGLLFHLAVAANGVAMNESIASVPRAEDAERRLGRIFLAVRHRASC